MGGSDVARQGWRWLWSALACLVLVGVTIAWLDRPIARFVHAQFPDKNVFDWMQRLPEWLTTAAALVLLGLIVAWALGRRVRGPCEVLARASLSLAAAVLMKDQLKFLFGRTWPETWVNKNPSYISDGVFGFFPLHGGVGWAAFPSGHMTAITSVLAVLWLRWPALRWLYALLWLDVVVGLLGADYHWLSDIVAGSFLGAAVGAVAARLGSGDQRTS
ncbi:MAG TPA: phosphatase PAP2 family protein [Stellaceae bacterium]|nr:phosphatase PAP2 family protein [Stellaceae bacterium]